MQWSRRIDELEAKGVKLVMVSIGKPEIGRELIEHLEFKGGENYLHVGMYNFCFDVLILTSCSPTHLPTRSYFFPFPTCQDPKNALYDSLDLNRGVKVSCEKIKKSNGHVDALAPLI